MDGAEFLKNHTDHLNVLGFWDEIPKTFAIKAIESQYKREILKEWFITDIEVRRTEVLVKWHPRMMKLSDEEVKEKYGE